MENHGKKQRRRLSAEEKWSIYQEREQSGAKIGEVLRKHDIYSSDLQPIRRAVKEAALERSGRSRPGRKKVPMRSTCRHQVFARYCRRWGLVTTGPAGCTAAPGEASRTGRRN
jgi:hypothetical protein